MNLPFFAVSEEVTIIETGGNEAGNAWDDTHTGLIDNEGLAGTNSDVHSYSKCGVSTGSTRPFFLMKLDAPRKILKVQLAQRTGCCPDQGQNVQVQVGSAPQYNANDPVCTEIAQLTGSGLVDYQCDQFHEGQYVILSNDQGVLTICEAKVFVEPTTISTTTTTATITGNFGYGRLEGLAMD